MILETKGSCPGYSLKFQVLGSWGHWLPHGQNRERSHLIMFRSPSKEVRLSGGGAADRGEGGSSGSLDPETYWPQWTWWLSVSTEPQSHVGRHPLRCPQRAPTHLGALGHRGTARGSRPPCPALQAASRRWSQGAYRQVPLSPGPSGPEVLPALISRLSPPQPAPHLRQLGPTSQETAALGSGRRAGLSFAGRPEEVKFLRGLHLHTF